VRAFVIVLQRFMGFIQRLWSGNFSEGVWFSRTGHSQLCGALG